jgi:putative addiction module killer protein
MNFGTGWVVCAIAELWRRIVSRIRRMELGNPGAVRQLGGGLAEMKVDYGPGYRSIS